MDIYNIDYNAAPSTSTTWNVPADGLNAAVVRKYCKLKTSANFNDLNAAFSMCVSSKANYFAANWVLQTTEMEYSNSSQMLPPYNLQTLQDANELQ